MLCQRCHKNLATVRYAEVIEGKVTDLHLCQDCLAKHREGVLTGFELSGSAPAPKRSKAVRAGPERLVGERGCKSCGIRLKEVLKSGRVGCSVCYESFAEQLTSLLRGIHTAMRHRGKVPHLDDARERVRVELKTRRALLRSALKMENYEEAAVLRDEIKDLETQFGPARLGQG